MRILGLDPSLTDTGWCVLDLELGEPAKVVKMGRIRTKSKDFEIVRYAKHREGVKALLDLYQPDYVGMEIPPPNASWSAGLYPIWLSFAEQCFARDISFATFLPTRIKSYARDILNEDGKMFKKDMVDAAKKLLGVKTKINHNIADAVIIAWLAWRLKILLDGQITEEDLTERELGMFAKTVKRQKTGKVEQVGIMYREGEKHYDLTLEKYEAIKSIFNSLYQDQYDEITKEKK